MVKCDMCYKPATAAVTYDWLAEGNTKRGAVLHDCMSDHCYGKVPEAGRTEGRMVVHTVEALPGCEIPVFRVRRIASAA